MSRRLALLATAVCALLVLGAQSAAAQEAVEYYATDALGSVRVVFASNGTVKGRMDFGPYGEQLTSAEGIGQKVFAQITFDGESAMDYAEARMFQIRTGRFNAPDPVYAGLEAPQRWNLYTYARNNPLRFVDPTGLQESSGPNPALCTSEIRAQNPLDFHCQQPSHLSGGTGAGFANLTFLLSNPFGRQRADIEDRESGGAASRPALFSAATVVALAEPTPAGEVLLLVGATALAVTDALTTKAPPGNFRHYTTNANAFAIQGSGVILPSRRDGITYLTRDVYLDGRSAQTGLGLSLVPDGILLSLPIACPLPTGRGPRTEVREPSIGIQGQ